MKTKKAFSRLDLMVVVVIAAFMMAILLPAAARMRLSARDAACQMNMRQLGICFDMYTKDNNGYFTDGVRRPGLNAAGIGDWLTALDGGYKFEARMTQAQINQKRDMQRAFSYIKDYEILKCPMATYFLRDDVPLSFMAWGGGPPHEDMGVNGNEYLPYAPQNVTGGYTHNNWCNNVPAGSTRTAWGCDVRYCWRTTAVEGAANIPVVADSHRWGVNVRGDNEPPSYDGEGEPSNGIDEIRRVCINRHNGAINILFMDWSVRRVRLTQLWDINTLWSRNWVEEINTYGTPDFENEAPWMKDF